MKKIAVIVATIIVVGFSSWVGAGDDEVFAQPETMLREIYSAVSSELGKEPDWDRVRSFFHPDAVIVLRATPEETSVMDVEGFIRDFQNFYTRINPEEKIFKEKVVSVKVLPYGNIAYGEVVYEAGVTPSERPAQRGLDAWHLVKENGRWWFTSVVNDNELIAGPIPKEAFAD